jgi:hypothetical protein
MRDGSAQAGYAPVRFFRTTGLHGKQYEVPHYDLDMIQVLYSACAAPPRPLPTDAMTEGPNRDDNSTA